MMKYIFIILLFVINAYPQAQGKFGGWPCFVDIYSGIPDTLGPEIIINSTIDDNILYMDSNGSPVTFEYASTIDIYTGLLYIVADGANDGMKPYQTIPISLYSVTAGTYKFSGRAYVTVNDDVGAIGIRASAYSVSCGGYIWFDLLYTDTGLYEWNEIIEIPQNVDDLYLWLFRLGLTSPADVEFYLDFISLKEVLY